LGDELDRHLGELGGELYVDVHYAVVGGEIAFVRNRRERD
jgi:hypothetical protein